MSSSGFESIRRANAESKNAEYISATQLIPDADKNSAFYLVLASTPIRNRRIGDVDDFLKYDPATGAFNIYWVDDSATMHSRSSFSFSQATWRLKTPPFDSDKWTEFGFGFKTALSSFTGGDIRFHFRDADGLLRIAFVPWGASTSQLSLNFGDLTALNGIDFSSGFARYSIKLRKSSAEFYYNNSLVCIAQCGVDADYVSIRLSDPYVLLQTPGLIPNKITTVFGLNSADSSLYGTDSGGNLSDISVVNSFGKDMRFLKPYTSGSDWEGTVIAAGNLTSDAIPVAGFERKAVNFIASTDGNLDIYVNYGTRVTSTELDWDLLTTRAITVNTFDQYELTTPILWIRLVWRPTAHPSTVTRCRVSMQE